MGIEPPPQSNTRGITELASPRSLTSSIRVLPLIHPYINLVCNKVLLLMRDYAIFKSGF